MQENLTLQTPVNGPGKRARDLESRDIWVEAYLLFLESLNHQSGGGPVFTRAVNVATRAYGAFCGSGDIFYRRSSWQAISAACQLFAQRSHRN